MKRNIWYFLQNITCFQMIKRLTRSVALRTFRYERRAVAYIKNCRVIIHSKRSNEQILRYALHIVTLLFLD